MPSSFDGAGDPYRGSSFRAWIIVGIVCLVVIGALLWLGYEALDMIPPGVPTNEGPPAN